MTSVRTEAQKRAASEAVENVPNGCHEVSTTDTSEGEDASNTTGLESTVKASLSVKTDYGVMSKRPKLSRKNIPQGANSDDGDGIIELWSSPKTNGDVNTNSRRSLGSSRLSITSPRLNGLDAPRNPVQFKSGIIPVCQCGPLFPFSPYVKLKPLPSSLTVPLNEGQSVKLSEILTDLKGKEKDREIVDHLDNVIKVEPDTEEMILEYNTYDSSEEEEMPDFSSPLWSNKGSDTEPLQNITDHIHDEVAEQSNNDTEKRKSSRHERASTSIDNDIKMHEMRDCVRCDDISKKRRSRGIPRRFDDFVYDVNQMVVRKIKVEPEQNRNSVPRGKGWKWIYRPKTVAKKKKLRKTTTKQNIKNNVNSVAKDIQQSKKMKSNLHHEEVPVSPKDSGSTGSKQESISSPEVGVLQESNKTEHIGNITSDNETSPGVSELESKPSSPLKKGCRPRGNRGKFVEDDTFYAVVSYGTQRGAKRLVGADGYTYNITKSNSTGRLYWRCSYRPTNEPSCSVVLKNEGTGYMKKNIHSHHPAADAFVKCFVSGELKKKCLTDFLHKPQEVVEKILKENESIINQSGGKFNVPYLVRRFNRARKQLKDKNPLISSVKFEGAFPKPFLIEDVVFGKKRHMLFATKKQLQLLARSDRWYIDITSKFVRKPFTHLLSVSAYVQDDTNGDERIKIKPLTFIVMSSLQMTDVVKVLRALLKHLRKPILVRSFVLDFFEPLWTGVRRLFFNCKLYGCAWKFGQCIWGKIQKLGIKDDHVGLYDEIHKLLKLPFVHPKKVRSTYEMLKVDFLSDPAFEDLIRYMEFTWLHPQVWKISNWCVHGNPFRTKIEVIGWHYAIHSNDHHSFKDTLVKELNIIAASIPDCTRPAHQRTVQKHYLESETTPQGKIYKLWAQESSMAVYDFLSLCCELSEPTMEGMVEKMIEEFRRREECPEICL